MEKLKFQKKNSLIEELNGITLSWIKLSTKKLFHINEKRKNEKNFNHFDFNIYSDINIRL